MVSAARSLLGVKRTTREMSRTVGGGNVIFESQCRERYARQRTSLRPTGGPRGKVVLGLPGTQRSHQFPQVRVRDPLDLRLLRRVDGVREVRMGWIDGGLPVGFEDRYGVWSRTG